jgi:hypothetical protein
MVLKIQDTTTQSIRDHVVVGGAGDNAEDVLLQGETVEYEEDVAAPFGVVGGFEIHNNRNQVPDVLDGGGLAVEAGENRGVRR